MTNGERTQARRRARQAALQILYQADTTGVNLSKARGLYWQHLAESAETQEFTDQLVNSLAEHSAEIDEWIARVSHHWRIERMSRVDRNILRLAIVELSKLPEIPARVTLNEAVELAKRYGSEGSAAFVNGVLDKVASELEKA